MIAKARTPFALTFGRCLGSAWLPVLVLAACCYGLSRWFAPTLVLGAVPAGAAAPWLELAVAGAAALTVVPAVLFWPTFARHRPGQEVVERLQRGPWRGAGAAVLATLLAQLVLTLPLTTVLARGLGAAPIARAHLRPEAPPQPLLTADAPSVAFALPQPILATMLELRPAAVPGATVVATTVAVVVDGERLPGVTASFTGPGQLARLEFAARTCSTIELVHAGGNVPLLFPTGSVVVIGDRQHSGLANGAVAAGLALLPTFVALAVACLCGTAAALPTVLTVALALLFLGTIGGVGPFATAIPQLLRGHWIATSAIFAATLPSLATGSAAMIAAMLLRRRTRA